MLGGTERIRGAALRAFALWYSGRHGIDRFPRWLEGLTAEQRGLFDPSRADLGFRDDRWYPAPAVHGLLDGIVRDLGPQATDELVHQSADAIIEASLNGFLQVLFRLFVTPAACRMFGQQHWSFHYESGRVMAKGVGATAQRMQVSGWRSHHPVLCQLVAAAGAPLIRATGGRDVTSRAVACIDRGDPCCVYWTEWR